MPHEYQPPLALRKLYNVAAKLELAFNKRRRERLLTLSEILDAVTKADKSIFGDMRSKIDLP